MSRYIPPEWINRLAVELEASQAEGETSIEAQNLRAREVRDHGPAVFKILSEHAREACWALNYQWYSAANWFTVKDNRLPFRMLQATLDIQRMGIALTYTLGSMTGGHNPTERTDFIDIRIHPPENYLILIHQGVASKPVDVLEVVFRNAFMPQAVKAAPKPKTAAAKR